MLCALAHKGKMQLVLTTVTLTHGKILLQMPCVAAARDRWHPGLREPFDRDLGACSWITQSVQLTVCI